jgi:serine protease Do
MGIAASKGALITDVPDGPAKDAGLLSGDVILTFNGEEITDVRDLTRTVADSPIGEAVPVLVLREGSEQTIDVTLGRRETAEGEAEPAKSGKAAPAEPKEAELLGLKLVPLDDTTAKELGLDPGAKGLAVTHVDPASEAATKGLSVGDVIVEAGQRPVERLSDLTDRVEEAKEAGRKSLLLLVRREGDPRFVALSFE